MLPHSTKFKYSTASPEKTTLMKLRIKLTQWKLNYFINLLNHLQKKKDFSLIHFILIFKLSPS